MDLVRAPGHPIPLQEGTLMGIQFSDDVTIPESTGAVMTPIDPVTTEQTPGHPVSTGAAQTPDAVVTTFGPSGPVSTGAVETPGPVTTEAPSLKVIRAPEPARPTAQTTAETTESAATAESRREARAAERAAQPADPDAGR